MVLRLFNIIIIFFTVFFYKYTIGQVLPTSVYENRSFTKYDTLRGKLTTKRQYDVKYYNLNLFIDFENQSIKGYNIIKFIPNKNLSDTFQIDLFANLKVDSIKYNTTKVLYFRDSNHIFIPKISKLPKDNGNHQTIIVYYQGIPRLAKRAPWDGGFVWQTDKNGKPFLGVACEGLGASSWWPCKDHLSDEPDSMDISISVPNELMAICNGNLRSRTPHPTNTKYSTFNWHISYPINNYNVTLNVADYKHFQEVYNGKGGILSLDYYVLSYNLNKAKRHFEQVKTMLNCFETKIGPYPFYKDGYALVETSYWGMEHQGAIAYGNNYQNNKWGFDFIIVHESGHEWFGNNISINDHCDMWIHESFTTYTEAILMECLNGYPKAVEYLNSQKPLIKNLDPMQGPYNVNFDSWKGSDIYYKGSWMLHTLRSVVDDDLLWSKFLRGTYDKFRLSNINTQQMIDYMSQTLNIQMKGFFEQYLYYKNIPVFEYKNIQVSDSVGELEFRWKVDVKDFNMPVDIELNGVKRRVFPTTEYQTIRYKKLKGIKSFKVDTSKFLVDILENI